MATTQSQKTVAEWAGLVLRLFQQCFTLPASLHPQKTALVEDQLARFSIWTSSIGVFAAGRASMDHRLREAPEVHDAVTTLLESVSNSMQNVLSILRDIIDAQNKIPEDGSSTTQEELDTSIRSLATDITLLYRLSNTIQRASKKSRNLEAAKSYCIRDDDGNNAEPLLQAVYEHYIRGRFPEISDDLSQRLASSMVLRRKRILYRRSRYGKAPIRTTKTAPEPKIEAAPVTSQQQVLTTLEVPKDFREDSPAQSPAPLPSIIQSAAPSATTLAAESYKKAAAPSVVSATKTVALGNHEGLIFPPAPLGRVRQRHKVWKKQAREQYMKDTDFPPYSKDQLWKILLGHPVTDRKSGNAPTQDPNIQKLMTKIQNALKLEWDKCLQAVNEVICPFCLYALPCISISDDKRWKAHVTNDLDPYVCLFDDCDQPDELFSHSDDWRRHMREHTLRWRCNSKSHGVLVFPTEGEYLSHMREAHSSFTEPQLQVLAKRNGRPIEPMFKLCPICGTSDATDSLDHIIGHLRSLALKSLPAYEDETSESSDGETGSSATSKTRSTVRNDPDKHVIPVFQELENDPILFSHSPGQASLDPYARFGGFKKYLALQGSRSVRAGPRMGETNQGPLSFFVPPAFTEKEPILWYKDPSIEFVTADIMDEWNRTPKEHRRSFEWGFITDANDGPPRNLGDDSDLGDPIIWALIQGKRRDLAKNITLSTDRESNTETTGHGGNVQLLLDKGAEVNAQGGDFDNAPQAASYRGHGDIPAAASRSAPRLASGSCLQTLKGHSDYVRSIAFSPDGQRLASGSDDRTIKIWDAASGSCLQTLEGHSSYVYSVAFSPDGQRLASGSNDKTIKIWDLASGNCLQTLEGHSGSVYSVAFSPDGQRLASGRAIT
ncbi:hypothetical protein QBC32DRAFT_324617 [Pseudoneurospora amorphoporcata]|uniref:Vegetative incompatibility protein HET-E-1 n=1 Tax=Pseudoneurospora amorphoporcata TaxID=241081 RepID=A0AAN6NY18_9PEZI|nr:hypothetical protein QBC32DRAFT_324617 [Pseudoneurospora amorphoporcata]